MKYSRTLQMQPKVLGIRKGHNYTIYLHSLLRQHHLIKTSQLCHANITWQNYLIKSNKYEMLNVKMLSQNIQLLKYLLFGIPH